MPEFKFGSLRDNKANPNRLESTLREYLEYIFPDEEIIFDQVIDKKIWLSRAEACTDYRTLSKEDVHQYHRYRPDARIEAKNLIIEFDGIQHYTSVKVLNDDAWRDCVLECLGYHVIRIPFFVQLTTDVIKHFFNIDVEHGSKIPSGFYSVTSNITQANPNCPASFCGAGLYRFIRNLHDLPVKTRKEIAWSLACQNYFNLEYLVLPPREGVGGIMDEVWDFIYEYGFIEDVHIGEDYPLMEELDQLFYSKVSQAQTGLLQPEAGYLNRS